MLKMRYFDPSFKQILRDTTMQIAQAEPVAARNFAQCHHLAGSGTTAFSIPSQIP